MSSFFRSFRLPILIFLAVWACASSCENDVNEVRELGRKHNGIEEGTNIDSYLSMGGVMKAHLTAPLLVRTNTVDSGVQDEFPRSLHVDFYNDSMKVESQLRARYGKYFEGERKVYLKDSVVIFNIKGDTLFCEDLYWDQDQQKFYTNRKVVWSKNYRATLIIGLDGMKASQDMTKIDIFRIQPNSYSYVSDSTQAGDTTKKKAGTP